MKCSCGVYNIQTNTYCWSCGVLLELVKEEVCPCGQIIEAFVNYCTKCGMETLIGREKTLHRKDMDGTK